MGGEALQGAESNSGGGLSGEPSADSMPDGEGMRVGSHHGSHCVLPSLKLGSASYVISPYLGMAPPGFCLISSPGKTYKRRVRRINTAPLGSRVGDHWYSSPPSSSMHPGFFSILANAFPSLEGLPGRVTQILMLGGHCALLKLWLLPVFTPRRYQNQEMSQWTTQLLSTASGPSVTAQADDPCGMVTTVSPCWSLGGTCR